ncbi:unnamed protein product [Cuscuta epithymum]|uniref:Myb/SANT-like DNA-binding domain-containing protein n=1 Tax=Cuscuta epithymum TaxID=186058 RepID=A0AAV0C2D3_9ASTE|nr:unnamed protein product [Cuscuta epithymum]
MEDNDEMESGSSEGTESPAPPRSDGRIAVTVAVPAPPQSTKCLALALPVQQQGKPASGGREDCWSEDATAVLIDAWGERYLELSRGNLKQKHWKDVADIVSRREGHTKTPKSDVQCKNRIDTVKKKYKLEKAKMGGGHGPSRWAFFEKLDRLIGPAARINYSAAAAGPSVNGALVRSSAPHLRQHQPPSPPVQQKHRLRSFPKKSQVDSDSSDSLQLDDRKRRRFERMQTVNLRSNNNSTNELKSGGGRERDEEAGGNWGKSVREMSGAILKFGEAYERTERAKMEQMVEMEKERMKLVKEIELQRLQFFMQSQMDLFASAASASQ